MPSADWISPQKLAEFNAGRRYLQLHNPDKKFNDKERSIKTPLVYPLHKKLRHFVGLEYSALVGWAPEENKWLVTIMVTVGGDIYEIVEPVSTHVSDEMITNLMLLGVRQK